MKTNFEAIQSKSNHPVNDVIIAGAGPVGLLLACELALAKCSVLMLEKAETAYSPFKQMPFGIRGLSAPSIEALYRRNLLQALTLHQRLKNPHSNAVEGPKRQVGHFAGIAFHEGNIESSQWPNRLPSATAPSLLTEMEELETALTQRAISLGVRIKRGFALTGFTQNEEGVQVQCATQSFEGKWLVGCDGSRSMVRKLGGFEFAGTEPEFTGYSALVELLDPEQLRPGRNITTTGMYIQSQPGYLALQEFDAGAGHDGLAISLSQFQEVLRRVSNTNVSISALHRVSTWTDRARQATSYRKGRVLLAGDAAHIHSPLGGQGLNLGLGDAMNLGWKLAATIKEQAAEGLLDSYFAERQPIGAQVLDWSRAQVAIMKPEPAARALHAIFSDLLQTPDAATYMASRVWGIDTHYTLGDGHPLIGHSVPNFELADGSKVGELLADGKGLVLDFEGDALLATAAQGYKHQINYVTGPAKDQLGLSALLIRPDGIVAWASTHPTVIAEFENAAARWWLI